MKRLLSLILAVLMLLSCFAGLDFSALANVPVGAEGRCGADVWYKYDYDEDTIYITGKGAMYDYNGAGGVTGTDDNNPFTSMPFTKVSVGEGVTSIGAYSFYEHFFARHAEINRQLCLCLHGA